MRSKALKEIVLILLVITGLIFYERYKEKKQRQKKEEEEKAREREKARQKVLAYYKENYLEIKRAANEFSFLLEEANGYFTNYLLKTWKEKYRKLHVTICGQPFEAIGLGGEEVATIKSFQKYYINGAALREQFNNELINQELRLYNGFFDDIEGRSLDEQQRRAIITDEDNNLVIAGAGSGKTTTIVGKVHYVLDRYRVQPEEILLISFTRRSAQSLKERINIEGVEAKTFHKFGMDVIAEVDNRQPSIFDEAQFRSLLIRFFNEEIRAEQYLKKVTEYFTNFLKPVKSQSEFESQGEYYQYLKDQNFSTYKVKAIDYRGRRTLKREVVKSIEECRIANFLLFNGLVYEYEAPYEHDTADRSFRQYKPDFTVTQGNRKYYIEHFAVGRNGDVPPFFAKEGESQQLAKTRYWQKIEWARGMHNSNETPLIETYSYEMSENTLFDNLRERLQVAGVVLHPKSPEEIWAIIQKAAEDEVKGFVDLFGTFITLMKSNSHTIEDVLRKNEILNDDFQRQRNARFIEITRPIYSKYQEYLRQRGEIDFSDMINKASAYIATESYKKKFSYVIIDEFQDISIGRYQLVKAVKEANPSCRLFCVGDDWQSIYRFTGSDIALFKEFENYFGCTVKSKIETTYRFHSPLITLSSEFILKNPNQADKELKSADPQKETQYRIVYSISDNQDDTLALRQVFDELIATKVDIEEKVIYVLGRYAFDIDRIRNESYIFNIDKESGAIIYRAVAEDGNLMTLNAKFLTVHKAKGDEAEIVIVLNCNSGKHGFPSGVADDLVLNLLLSEADQFENGEERRLFYVAMTRAKENVYFIADATYKSKFITELEVNNGGDEIRKCPRCITADLILRSGAKDGRQWAFEGCSNYVYGCDYKEWVN